MPVGGSNRSLRQFLRSIGARPNASAVDVARQQLNCTESQYERRAQIARETGNGGLRNQRGEAVVPKVRDAVKRSIAARKEPRRPG